MRRLKLPASRAGRALAGFWAALLLLVILGVGTLQWLGPPRRVAPRPRMAASRPVLPGMTAAMSPSHAPALAQRRDIAAPDPALLEPAPGEPGEMLPRIGADGRRPMQVYAAAAPVVPAAAKRVGLLIDGIGLSEADSLDAISRLPAAVSLAVSPYATSTGTVLEAARRGGHELLLSLPMEPRGAPADDEGGRALTEQVSSDENRLRLDWALSRIEGYAGVTNAFVGMSGERFVAGQQFEGVVAELGRRGLFYLDASPGSVAPSGLASAVADVRLGDPADASTVDGQFRQLEQIARSQGSAIGVAGPLHPVMIEHLAEWAQGLAARGLVLVPVSSLLRRPQAGVGHAPG